MQPEVQHLPMANYLISCLNPGILLQGMLEKEREGRGRAPCSVFDSNEKRGQGSGGTSQSFGTHLECDITVKGQMTL